MAGSGGNYLAWDLGAESGRGILGRFDGHRLELEEIHRFSNQPVRMLGTLYWDLPRLVEGIKGGLRKVDERGDRLASIGVDTWGVDFGLVGRGDVVMGMPVHYRDTRTHGMIAKAFEKIPRQRLYELTGLQILPINTVYQLLAMRQTDSPILDQAETLLMMGDLLGFLLTGVRAGEWTNASTTQLLEARTRRWSLEICHALEIPEAILPELVEPGHVLGPLAGSVVDEVGLAGVPVIAPATHDTASAVAAVPAVGTTRDAEGRPNWCYISSGSWSLMGVETTAPVIDERTAAANFTNEGGIAGTTRLLKNIMGLWLVQECRRTWSGAGREFSYAELAARAEAAVPFRSVIDPDFGGFLAPGDMPSRIAEYCRRSDQPVPEDEGGFVRCALEALALKYRWVLDRLEEILGGPIATIHVVGGGGQNALLNQLTADACKRPVHAGPVEATAIGNLLVQSLGLGHLGSPSEIREVVARSFPVTVYEPRADHAEAWDQAQAKLQSLLNDPRLRDPETAA